MTLLHSLDAQLKPAQPAYQAYGEREVGVSDYIPYAAHYDAHTLLTKNEDLLRILKIEGLPFETADERFLALRKLFRNNLLRAMAKSQYAVYVHTIRRRQPAYPHGVYPHGFSQQLDRAWRKRHETFELFVNDIYVTIVRKPRMKGVAGIRGLLAKYVGKAVKEEHEAALKAAARELDNIVTRFITTLADYQPRVLGIERDEHGEHSTALRFLGYLINLQERRLPVPRMDLSRYLATARHIFGKDALEVRGMTQSTVAAMISVKEYPEETQHGMLDTFLETPVEMIITQSFVFLDRSSAEEKIKEQQDRLAAAEDPVVEQIEGLSQARADTRAGRTAEGLHHMTVMVLSDQPADLEKNLARVEDAFITSGVMAVREDWNMELAFWAQLPGNFSFITRGAQISTLNFAGFASLHNYGCGTLRGNHWGDAITVLETRSGTPYFYNHHVGQVGHTLITAPTGAGKSTLLNALIAFSMKYARKVIYFDRDHGGEIFVRAMRGTHVTISRAEKSGFNPLRLPDTEQSRSFLIDWFRLLFTAYGESLTAEDDELIKAAVTGNYRLDETARTLRNIAPFFGMARAGKDGQPPNLAFRLQNWFDNPETGRTGLQSAFFDNDDDQLDLHIALYGFEMGRIIDDPVALAPVAAYLFHRIELALNGDPVIIVLEEGWKLIRNPYFAAMLDSWLMTIRKRNGMVIFVTPDPAAIFKHGSDAIEKQVFNKIFMAHETADRETYVDRLKLSEGELETIRTIERQNYEFLIRHGSDSVIAKLDLSAPELRRFIPVLSGNTKGVELMRAVMRELGSEDPDIWLETFLQRSGT